MVNTAVAIREQEWRVTARHYSVQSAWIARDDWRLDAPTYTGEVYEALRVLAACRYGTAPLKRLIGDRKSVV